ncbi:MAG TPA: hypothetical protein DD381_09005 [Lentisphaeria bacterium]|nr:MAG: hypothetical protein A2X47_07855 [Lentisphaerae bacterium GWF2_38_69]HBM16460.1 hypothetical protein [Lentisphaeria bacterium]
MESVEFDNNITKVTDKGTISINESLVISIVKNAVLHVPGVVRLTSTGKFSDSIAFMLGRVKARPDSIDVILTSKELYISVRVIISYGVNINELGLKLQMAIAGSIKAIAQIDASRIDIFVENIEDQETNNNSLDLRTNILEKG